MRNQTYHQKLENANAVGPDSGEDAFFVFAESLNASDWFALLEDLLNNSVNAKSVFRPGKGEDLAVCAAGAIEGMSVDAKNVFAKAFESLVFSCLERKSVDGNLILLASKMPSLRASRLMRVFADDESLEFDLRRRALSYLSDPSFHTQPSYWESIDLVKHPDFAPSVAAAYSTINPERGLRLLEAFPDPRDATQFEIPLRMIMRRLVNSGKSAEITAVYKFANGWLRSSIEQLSNASEFVKLPLLSQPTNVGSEIVENKPVDLAAIAEIESTYNMLQDIIVVCHMVERPSGNLLDAVEANMARGVRYTFVVSESSFKSQGSMYFDYFKTAAQIVSKSRGNRVDHLDHVVRILPLRGEWNRYPCIFYKAIEDELGVERTVVYEGLSYRKGICDQYREVPRDYASVIYSVLEPSVDWPDSDHMRKDILSIDDYEFLPFTRPG